MQCWNSLFHERVQPTGGFAQEQQVGSCHQTRDEGQLLPVVPWNSSALLRGVESEPLDLHVPVRRVDSAVNPPDQVQGLLTGQ